MTGCGSSDTSNAHSGELSEREDSNADIKAQAPHSLDLFAMDTYMNIKAYGTNADTALSVSSERIKSLEKIMSVTDKQSEIWALNNSEGKPINVSDDISSILNIAQKVSAESKGALCISIYPVLREWGFTTGNYKIPSQQAIDSSLLLADDSLISISNDTVQLSPGMQIDLGSLAKGYTGDEITKIMKEQEISSAIINLGGNVQTLGTKPDGSEWTVAVTDPFDTNNNMGIIKVSDRAVITSGNYERYFDGEDGKRYWHIIDPKDGYPADNGIVSATVIGESGVYCDALSTALFVEGTELAKEHWKKKLNFEMILVTDDRRIILTPGIAEKFVSSSDMPIEVIS